MESGILGFAIRISAQGIRNPTKDPRTTTEKYWNPVSGIRNPKRGFQNPILSWISLHGAKRL